MNRIPGGGGTPEESPVPGATDFWRVVWLLLRSARKRAVGRQKRQQELLRRRTKRKTFNWGPLAFFGAFVLTTVLNVVAVYVLYNLVAGGERLDAERTGKVLVERDFYERAWYAEQAARTGRGPSVFKALEPDLNSEARSNASRYGGDAKTKERELRAALRQHGTRDLLPVSRAAPGLGALPGSHSFAAMLGSIVLLWWTVMLVFQGEGLELDLQRRRHPMWEWLFAHPVEAGAVFLAEMLSPIAANPVYWAAPLFFGGLYGLVYGVAKGALAAGLVGIPASVAAACLGKALEIAILLRFAPRSRGALIGIMSWFAYASMMLFLIGASTLSQGADTLGRHLEPLTRLPWPWLGWLLGRQTDGSFSYPAGVLAGLGVAIVMIAVAVWFSAWGARQGLSGNFGRADSAPASSRSVRFGKEPLYRKELLWFLRDRSAIVQTILIPLTIAGFQAFNLRHLLEHAQHSWNYICGIAVLIGTYFLWVLGPKSLASEGAALWISLTWPRGLENLLKAKAWLWTLISTGIVALALGYAIYLYPPETWKILLVAVGWAIFGRSMAEKSVTLVTVASASGEADPVPRGRRWAASLGMLTFAIGIFTQQWQLAIIGIVYSYLTAAAMWENFRARLPYLYDPWSEKLPPPPTLVHAMIGISIQVEIAAVVTGVAAAFAGRDYLAIVRAITYAICALLVSVGMARFLSARGVSLGEIWRWRPNPAGTNSGRAWTLAGSLLMGIAGGTALGLCALGYLALLREWPVTAELLRKSAEQMAMIRGWQTWYAVSAVVVAPFAEEYLFRGLLFRSLDREWGGWQAVLGSAAFFAIYHPPLSWVPVGLLGAVNAILFKRTGWLAPAVLLHMVYNAIVLLS